MSMGPPSASLRGFRLLGRCIGRMSHREVSVIEIREMLPLWLQGRGLRWPKSYDASLRMSWRQLQPTDPPHKRLNCSV
jgi:hypothetical protein